MNKYCYIWIRLFHVIQFDFWCLCTQNARYTMQCAVCNVHVDQMWDKCRHRDAKITICSLSIHVHEDQIAFKTFEREGQGEGGNCTNLLPDERWTDEQISSVRDSQCEWLILFSKQNEISRVIFPFNFQLQFAHKFNRMCNATQHNDDGNGWMTKDEQNSSRMQRTVNCQRIQQFAFKTTAK